MSTLKPVRLDIVSDVVCPWCYIGKRRIENALAQVADVPVEVHWRPFFLNPWVPREGISREDYLTTKFGSVEAYKGIAGRVVAAAGEEGLSYRPDLVKRQPNTIDCHRLIHWAEAKGKAAEMKQRLMELYFRDGGDLTDTNVLVQAAADVGLAAEETRRREFLRTWDLVAKVPFFHDVGAAVIADVARLLRPREYPAGAIIMRRGAPGDCMYFVASGEVEVQLHPEPVVLGPGEFFGEVALVTGGPRNATIVAVRPCTLLILDIVDFRELLGRQPELARVIHEEAERRPGAAARSSARETRRRRGPRG